MRRSHLASVLVASIHVTALVTPAFAQEVKPVPYGASQPVPYGQPAPPPNPSAGRDVIYLKNGGLLRGTLIDVIPSSHARIQLETGEIATVSWTEINRIDRANAPQVEQPAAPAQVAPAAPAAPRKQVLVHIEAPDKDVYLLADTGHEWERACSSPCDKWMSTDLNYKLAGPSVRQSKPFSLQGENGDRVVLDVNTASSGTFTLGVVGTVVGSISLGIGALVYLVGAVENSTCSFDASTSTTTSAGCTSSKSGNGAEGVGGTMMLVGLVAGVAGIVAIASNGHTSVSQEVEEPVKRGTPRNDAWLRLPTWNDTTKVSAAPGMALPLLSGTF
jgi:hypothetical protein